MDFTDYTWDQIEGTLLKRISWVRVFISTKTDMAVSIDYIPKIQARKFSLTLKNSWCFKKRSGFKCHGYGRSSVDATDEFEIIEEMETEEVTSFMEIMPSTHRLYLLKQRFWGSFWNCKRKWFCWIISRWVWKLQNYKKLLDNGLILQGEYDAYKKRFLLLCNSVCNKVKGQVIIITWPFNII
jgi:hypothetical protein